MERRVYFTAGWIADVRNLNLYKFQYNILTTYVFFRKIKSCFHLSILSDKAKRVYNLLRGRLPKNRMETVVVWLLAEEPCPMILDLPNEIILKIIDHMDPETRRNFASLSPRFADLHIYWREVVEKKRMEQWKAKAPERFAKRKEELKKLMPIIEARKKSEPYFIGL